jgi:hypothetical protein
LTVSAIAIAISLNAIQNQLYRVLEGYVLQSFWESRKQKHILRKHRLKSTAEEKRGLERALWLERAERYPANDSEVAPTRFGNAIRSFETYGEDRFRLDSQLLWSELVAVLPESVGNAVDRARAPVDFFVCLTYLFAVLGVTAMATSIFGHEDRLQLAAVGLGCCLLTVLTYHIAVISTDHWSSTVKALVNLGRKPLAEALGLRLPSNLDDEREMWRLVNRLVAREFDKRIVPRLAEFSIEKLAGGPGLTPSTQDTDGT